MKEYHHLHLKSDAFCQLIYFKNLEVYAYYAYYYYGLCHYMSVPAFSWDAMLSMAKVELDLTSIVGM